MKIYLHPPDKYEEIAVLNSNSRGSFAFSQQGRMDAAIERLKSEAARLGANGVLLQSTGDQYGGSVGTGFGSTSFSGHSAFGLGTGVSAPVMVKSADGLAIFVP